MQGNWDRRCFFGATTASEVTWLPTELTVAVWLVLVRALQRKICRQPSPKGHDGGTERQQCQESGLHQRKSKSSSDSPEKAFITSADSGMKIAAATRISTRLIADALTLLNIAS